MPRHDPVPQKPSVEAAAAWARYRRLMVWMALAAAATAGLSVFYLWLTVAPLPFHMVIATLLGVGLTVLVGTALMGLVFVSNRAGHDEGVGRGSDIDHR